MTTLPTDIPQEIIDCLTEAKGIKDKDLKLAQNHMHEIRHKVISLTDSLVGQTDNERVLYDINKFKNGISQEKLWWINGTKNSEGLYCALYPKVIEKYSNDMAQIKESLKKL